MDGERVPTLRKKASMSTGPDQSTEPKFVVTNTLIVSDIKRSVAFYRDVLAATVLHDGEPTFLRLGNLWLTINTGGGGTDDKPDVVAAPPRDPNVLSNFIRGSPGSVQLALPKFGLAPHPESTVPKR
jgi:hypothetical protein